MSKKIISLLLSLCIALCYLSSFVCAAEEAGTEPVLGDMNMSGAVDIEDARAILRLSAAIDVITQENLSLADMNGDGDVTLEDVILALNQVAGIENEFLPEKNGENQISQDPDNYFIKLISQTYDVPADALVAIYSVPDTGTNYVLRFKPKYSLTSVSYPKDVDNLEYVYLIGAAPERKISYTNGKMVLGDHYNCEMAEGVLVFNLVKNTVMKQHPDVFTGVEE